MPQNPQDKFSRLDDIYDKYAQTMDKNLDAIGKTRREEMSEANRLNEKRMQDSSKGVERDTWGEFRSQFGAGLIESATMAPTLWDKLGINVSSKIEWAEGEYEGDWSELGEKGKIGFGLGTAAGALAPWGLAGLGVRWCRKTG